MQLTRAAHNGRFADWPLALKSILGFWVFYALTVLARALMGTDPQTVLENKLITIFVGIVLTLLVYVAIAALGRRSSVRDKAIAAGIASFVAAWAMAGFLLTSESWMRESREEMRYTAREGFTVIQKGNSVRIERTASEPLVLTFPNVNDLDPNKRIRLAADTAVVWLFFFIAWSAFYLATQAQAEALGARQRATEAESMILKLSTFFRSSLSLDPSADVSLMEEIALQRLYLDIEKVRFPRRLRVEIDVPKELESARLPALILQPIVENVIKYAVSPTRERITLRISAQEAGPGRFVIDVVNSGKPPKEDALVDIPEGTGVGLANVRQRLFARFGDAARVEIGEVQEGGYRVRMTLPLDRTDG
jgi:hypothetical protein